MTSDHTPSALGRLRDTEGVVYGIRLAGPSETPHQQFYPRGDILSFRLKPPCSSTGSGDESDNSLPGLDDIIGKTWRVHRVSPLSKFQYREIRFKQYGSKLKQYLANEEKDENVVYDAKFSTVPGLTRKNALFEAVKVEVICSKNGGLHVPCYIGYLLSWANTQLPRDDDLVHLPLLLCRGKASLSLSVNYCLENFFDCSIVQMHFSMEELLWISVLVPCICVPRRKHSTIKFSYTVPGLPVTDSIHACFPLNLIVKTWEGIHNPESEDIAYKDVKKFHDCLKEHVKFIFGINVGHCQLIRMKVIDIDLSYDGKVRFQSSDLAIEVLRFIYSLSNTLKSSVPSLCAKKN